MKQFACSTACIESDGRPCKTDDPSSFQCPVGEVNTMKLIPGTMTRRDILVDINKERARQDTKWGFPQRNNLAEWGIILGEEVGEVMQAMNEVRFRNEDIVADMNAARAAYKAKEVKEIPEDIKREMFSDPETPCTEREDYVTGHEVEPIRSEEVEAQPKPLMHILKCQQPYFDDIWEGYKTFEVRLNDREYEAGDSVLLIAYNAEHSIYETRQIFANIGYLLSGKSFPALLDEETVVFSLINIRRYELQEVGV